MSQFRSIIRNLLIFNGFLTGLLLINILNPAAFSFLKTMSPPQEQTNVLTPQVLKFLADMDRKLRVMTAIERPKTIREETAAEFLELFENPDVNYLEVANPQTTTARKSIRDFTKELLSAKNQALDFSWQLNKSTLLLNPVSDSVITGQIKATQSLRRTCKKGKELAILEDNSEKIIHFTISTAVNVSGLNRLRITATNITILLPQSIQ